MVAIKRAEIMFPRIKKSEAKGRHYKYLVVSESVYRKGKTSTTKDIAKLGNINKFTTIDIESLIDGLIKIFKLEKYSLTDEVKIIESLEYGNIVFWQKLWNKFGLSEIIKKEVKKKDKRIQLEVEKYVQMMVVNRCINPNSKLGVTRWLSETCYKEMKGYSQLNTDVTYFYRSMDQLLKVKDEVEFALFEKLRNLFSVNVKLTFYDITSTFFYTENCAIGKNGWSRDQRPDKKQIVIGVVTSYEGYPLKHFVFTGNTKDSTTVEKVIKELKTDYNIEETTFVGDRGMITKLNLDKILENGFDYIMGVKSRQDEICQMFFFKNEFENETYEEYNGLKIRERKVRIREFLIWKIRQILRDKKIDFAEKDFSFLRDKIENLRNDFKPDYKAIKHILIQVIKNLEPKIYSKIIRLIKKYEGKYEDELRYVICLNGIIKKASEMRRAEYLQDLSAELEKLFSSQKKEKSIIALEKSLSKIFEGYKSKYKKFFRIERDKKDKNAIGFCLDEKAIENEKRMDGIFVLLTNRNDLEISKVVKSYKNLKEVEMLFDDLKNFVDIRPVRHWKVKRVKSHVFICMLSLLLKRVFEINCLQSKAVTDPLEEISKVKLIKYEVKFSSKEERSKTLMNITNVNPIQKKYFKLIGIKNPMSLENYL